MKKYNNKGKNNINNNISNNTINSSNIQDKNEEIDFTKITPWNSREYPIRVNSIRYNQDFSLLTLGTSKGYKIFLTSTLRQAHDDSEIVKNLGDIYIAMCYYKSSLVFFLPSRYNKNFSSNEIIVFDDFYQNKIASFKDKSEELLNFFVSKNTLLMITLSKVIVVEIYTFKIIDIIDNINTMSKLLSYNFFDFIAFVKLKDKKKVFIKNYQNDNHKIVSLIKKTISSNFEFMQAISLSPLGNYIGIVSIFGNKIHIYNTPNETLKFCIYLGPYIYAIEKIFFSEQKSNYLFVLKNDNKFNIYKFPVDQGIKKCICDKYDDSNITTETKEEGMPNLLNYFKKFSKNKDIWESHASGVLIGDIEFIDFDRNNNKYIININKKGEFIKYHFNKTPNGNILPILRVQWQ